jgi:hypothetical protein
MNPTIAELTAKMQHGTRPVKKQGIKPNAWTEAENAVMLKFYVTGGASAVMKLVQRSRKAINCQAGKLGIKTTPRMAEWEWSKDQDRAIIHHYQAKGGAYVVELTGRSIFAVRRRAAYLGIRADKSLAAKVRYAKQKQKPNPPKLIAPKAGKKFTVMPPKARFSPLVGEPRITSQTKITIAPPFVDKRWIPDHVPSVVDSSKCRSWATQL